MSSADLQSLDGTLLDGLQSASVRQPLLIEKAQIIRTNNLGKCKTAELSTNRYRNFENDTEF
ncbi:MAG: hypothetical protein ACW98F_10485 [Candidatus Hodarchaeales archaeon]|jgi:hypothetical protein